MTYSLQRLLIVLGIIVIPFYELIFRMFPFVRVVSADTRISKEFISMAFALSIGLLAVFQGIKPFRNKYFLIIPVYLLFNLFMAPHVDLFINNVECGDLYFWRPFCQILCFLLMIIGIANIKFDDFILELMVICGSIMAGYVILQALGFDQFYIGRTEQNFTAVSAYEVGGNLGQPTIVASFLVMLVPLSMYLRKYYLSVLIISAVICTKSDMAILALILIGIIYVIRFLKFGYKTIITLLICIMIGFGFLYFKSDKLRKEIEYRASGRITVWTQIYTDIRDGALEGNKQDFSITGVGLGRFPFIFTDKHKSIFRQAHNEFLEWTYNCGLVGLGLLIFAIFYLINSVNISNRNFPILLSFITILFCSLGSFPFQLGAHQFYSAILVGLLNNEGVI